MRKKTLIASALALALLSGCGGKEATEHYSDALGHIEKQEFNAAVIELKSAIQQAPENIDFRFTLGQLYLELGEVLPAEKELQLAAQGGKNPAEVAIPLTRATYLATHYADVLSLYPESSNLPPEINDYISLYKALAELELGSADNALAIFSSLENSTQPGVASFAKANLQIYKSQYQDALDILNNDSGSYPHQQEILYLRANLMMVLAQDEDAYSALQQYLKQQPRQFKARLQAAQLAVKLEKFNDAKNHINLILGVMPDQPFTNYLAAVTAMNDENYTQAKEHIDKALNKGYKTTQARILAAIASMRLGLESQALHHLSAVESQLAAYPQLQRIYVALQLKENKSETAQQKLLDMKMTDDDLRLVAGTALELIKKGNTSAAMELVTKYESSMSNDAENLSALGQLKMSIPGEELAAIRNLEQALAIAPERHQTRLALAASYLKNGQFTKAEQLADSWIENAETANIGYNLKAYSSLLQKDLAQAANWLESASKAEADNALTLLLTAMIAIQQNKSAEAQQLAERILKNQPTYLPALRMAYGLARQNGDTAAVLKTAEQAQQSAPDNYELRLTLAQMLISANQTDKVISLLEKAPQSNAEWAAPHWTMLIGANAANGKTSEALRLSRIWHEQNPMNLRAGLLYANMLLRTNNASEALTVLKPLQNQNPGHVAITMMQVMALEANKEYDTALAVYEKLPENVRNEPVNLALKGRLLVLLKKPAPALETLLQSYDKLPANNTATIIADLYAKEISFRKGVEFIEQHMAKVEPTDALKSYYANLLIQSDPQKALSIYSTLVESQSENVIFLNNYAWLLLNEDKAKDAEPFAKKALELAPENADVIDTYGSVLLKTNQLDNAISQFEKALKIEPDNNEFKLNYADALLNAGRKADSKKVLQSVVSDDRDIKQRQQELQSKAEQ